MDQASLPSVRARTATEWAKTEHAAEQPAIDARVQAIDVAIESLKSAGVSAGGPRFGTLVHAVLADMPLAANADLIARIAAGHGRVVAATDDEVAAAAQVAAGVAAHPLWHRARQADAAGQCYRETPVTLRLGDTVIEGNVDLAFVEGDEVMVVDFKTDRDLEGALDTYRLQVQAYAAAVGTAMGKKARGVLLRV